MYNEHVRSIISREISLVTFSIKKSSGTTRGKAGKSNSKNES